MIPLTASAIRSSFVNASRKEVSDLVLPVDFDDLDWNALDYLGWRDPKAPKRAYLLVPTAFGEASTDAPGLTGVLLRQADASPASRAQCSWCQDVTLPNAVAFFSAKKSGAAGRKGDTVGTLVCEDFQCSKNVRRALPPAYLGYDVEAARQERILTLQVRAESFIEKVLGA